MAYTREIREGRQVQGEEEQVAYRLDTANWSADPDTPSTPSAVVVKIFSVTEVAGVMTYIDTSAANLDGAASVATRYITLPVVKVLVAATLYRVEVKFTLEGNIFEAYAYIKAEK